MVGWIRWFHSDELINGKNDKNSNFGYCSIRTFIQTSLHGVVNFLLVKFVIPHWYIYLIYHTEVCFTSLIYIYLIYHTQNFKILVHVRVLQWCWYWCLLKGVEPDKVGTLFRNFIQPCFYYNYVCLSFSE